MYAYTQSREQMQLSLCKHVTELAYISADHLTIWTFGQTQKQCEQRCRFHVERFKGGTQVGRSYLRWKGERHFFCVSPSLCTPQTLFALLWCLEAQFMSQDTIGLDKGQTLNKEIIKYKTRDKKIDTGTWGNRRKQWDSTDHHDRYWSQCINSLTTGNFIGIMAEGSFQEDNAVAHRCLWVLSCKHERYFGRKYTGTC